MNKRCHGRSLGAQRSCGGACFQSHVNFKSKDCCIGVHTTAFPLSKKHDKENEHKHREM
jgi:hypothetical protein